MKWIFEHFQIVILIGAGLASWLKRRQDVAPIAAPKRHARQPIPDDAAVSERAATRPIVRVSVPPVPRSAPLISASDASLVRQQSEIEDRLRQIRDPKATTTGGATATRARLSAARHHSPPAPAVKRGVRSALQSRKDIRRAIALREILGPPLGLR